MWFQNLRNSKPIRKAVVSRVDNPLITMDEANGFLRNLMPEDNDFVNQTILSVQRNIEAYCGIRIDSGTFDAYFRGITNELDIFDVPATITAVYATRPDGTEELLVQGTDYVVFQGSSPCVRILDSSVLWLNRSDWFNFRPENISLRVRYTAGNTNLDNVPPQVKTAMVHEVAFYYKNRQDGDQQAVVLSGELTLQAKNMLDPIRLRK